MKEIISPDNFYIKEVKSLNQKKNRMELGKYIIEGVTFIFDAINAGADIESLIISDKLQDDDNIKILIERANLKGIEIILAGKKVINEITDTVNPQGVCGVVKFKPQILTRNFLKTAAAVVILENIQDPGNLGTIIRTSAAADISGIILLRGCVDLYNPKVIRATMSAVFSLPIFHSDNPKETISDLKEAGFKILATSLNTDNIYFNQSFNEKTAVIFGNESNGISADLEDLCDASVKIPVSDKIESLNVSQSAAVILYEIVRQKMSGKE